MTQGLLRAAWGAVLLAAPALVLRAWHGDNQRRSRNLLRVLGARHLAQASRELRPSRPAGIIDPIIDGTHAVTATGLALADRRWRRPALTDAVIATVFTAAGAARFKRSR